MRISDWSSDVCSSDLAFAARRGAVLDIAIELAAVGEGGADAFAQHDARAVVDAKAEGFDIALQQLALGAGAQVVEAQLIGLHVGVVGEEVERSEEHTSELQSLMRISYAVFRLQQKTDKIYNSPIVKYIL